MSGQGTLLQQRAGQAISSLLLPLQAVLEDPEVTEVMVNGPDQIWMEQGGRLQQLALHWPAGTLAALALLLASQTPGARLAQQHTLEAAWQCWRVTVVLPPVSRDSACLCLRRHRPVAPALAQWQARPAPSAPASAVPGSAGDVLQQAVVDGSNILVSGSTGAGKTTLLASLLAAVPATERVLTLEDTAELPRTCAHQVRLLSGAGHDLRGLVRLALRLRPDRLVVGEVRGGEAFDLLQAMATGHRGCMGTVHAADPAGALARLEQLILTVGLDWPHAAVQAQLAQSLQLLVHVHRDTAGRAISTVQRLEGIVAGRYVLRPVVLR